MGAVAGIVTSVGFRAALQVAVVAASIALQIALRPKPPNVEGPRIGELGASSSALGAPIPAKGYGRYRLGTNMIWATDIVEVASKRKQGGGKGGGGGSITVYNYFGNAAFAVGIGTAGTLRRIWADSKIIYDATGNSDRVFKYDDTASLRVFLGTEDQEPDALIESVEGAGNVPGYRGLIYFVVENLPLEDFGNRIPQLQVEVEYETATAEAEVTVTNSQNLAPISAGLLSGFQQLFAIEQDSFGQNHLHRLSLKTNDVEERITVDVSNTIFVDFPNISGGLRAQVVHPGPDDRIMVGGFERTGGGDYKLVHINPYTLDPISVGSTDRSGLSPSTLSRDAHITFTQPATQGLRNWTLWFVDGTDGQSAFGPSHLVLWNRDGETSSGAPGAVASVQLDGDAPTPRTTIAAMTLGQEGEVWAIGIDGDFPADGAGRQARLYKIIVEIDEIDPAERQIIESVFSTAGGTGLGDLYAQIFLLLFGQESADVKIQKEFDLTQFGLHFDSSALSDTILGGGVVYNEARNEVVIFGDPDDNGDFTWVRWDPVTETSLQTRALNDTDDASLVIPWRTGSRLRDSLREGPRDGKVTVYRRASGDLFDIVLSDLTTEDLTDPTFQSVSTLFHDHRSNSVIYWPNNSGGDDALRQFLADTVAAAPALQAVVEGICGEAGFDPSELSFDSGFTGKTVVGYAFASQRNVRSALDPLLFAFTFDGVESDFLLKFVTRGVPATIAVPEEDLQARVGPQVPGTDVVLEIRNQEIEVPEQVTIRYIDEARDFQEATQSVRRHRVPNPTQFSEGPLTVEVPVVLPASTVRNAANTRLYNAWVERVQFELSLGPSYLRLDPTDPLDVTKGDVTLSMRLGQADLGVGLVQAVQGFADDVDTYTQDAPPAVADIIQQTVGLPGPTELILMDTPFMRDLDGTNDLATGIYAAFGANSESWRGASVLLSRDAGASFEAIGAAKDDATWGYLDAAVAALPLEASGARTDINNGRFSNLIDAWDRTTTIDVFIVEGEELLASTTEALVLNGANFAAIVKPTGLTEIFQFTNVTDLGGGRFRLDTLLRGRRGTELQAVAGHAAGERFVLLRSDDITFIALPLEDLTREFIWKVQSLGEPNFPVGGQVVPLRGENLKPLTPVRAAATPDVGAPRSGSAITVTWTRRTRFGGRNDFGDRVTNVPIGEQTESYEVGLLNPAGTAIVETFTASDDATGVSIPAASRTTAGYADTDAVNLVIYQVNAIIGRGQLLTVLL